MKFSVQQPLRQTLKQRYRVPTRGYFWDASGAPHKQFKGEFLMKRKRLSTLLVFCGLIYLFSFPAFAADAPQSKEAKEIVALVDKAAALIQSKGKTAFPEFKRKGSDWLKGDTYIFIADMNGTLLMHPANPELETKNILELKDVNGKAFMREFIETAKTKGSGWVDYVWPKPGDKSPSQKLSYIKRAKMPNGEMVLVGAGIYVK
jgi:methyl-accepting chemotaxis protein